MAGLYIHLPFCNEKCYYCDFFSGNQLYLIDDYVDALLREMTLKKSYLNSEVVDTIYLGGGTPSILTIGQLSKIMDGIFRTVNMGSKVEITIECNPENIEKDYVNGLFLLGFNRISLGVQFLDDDVLRKFNRLHSSNQIYKALDRIEDSYFGNLSVDLIYSVPGISDKDLEQSLRNLIKFDVKHYSAYSLTIAKNSRLFWKIQKGELLESKEDSFVSQYNIVHDFMEANQYYQYEVSNYSKKGYQSLHNLGYWNQVIYLGLGVSAHSYNLVSRQWNHTNIKKYIRDLEDGKCDVEIEYLTETQRYNEYVILRLRTFLGLSYRYIKENFSNDLVVHFEKRVSDLLARGHFVQQEDLVLSKASDLLLADYLAKFLMF